MLAGLLVLGATGALVALLAARRLVSGEIDLGFLVPRFERALSGALPSGTVRLGGAGLVWDATTHRPALHVRDVRLLAPDGEALAVLPLLALRPSLRALRHGTFAAERIELIGAQLRASRTPEGRLTVSVEGGGGTGGRDLLQRLHATREGTAGWLRRVELRDGMVILTDPSSGATWSASDVDLAITRRPDALTFAGSAMLGVAAAPLRLEAVYRAEPPGLDATLRFERMMPVAAASLVPGGAVRDTLARIDLPFEGTLSAVLDGDLALHSLRVDAKGGPGRIAVAELPVHEVAVRQLRLATVLDAESQTLAVERLAFDLGTTQGEVRGRVSELHAARRLDLTAKITEFPAGDLAAWWPRGAGRKMRDWVTTRIAQGTIREATIRLVGGVPEGRLVAETIEGAATFDGLGVRYFDKLPPGRALAGTATLKEGRWQFDLTRGAVDDLEVTRGTVGIAARKAGIDLALRGPLVTALDLAERVGAGDLGIARDGVGGAVTGTIRLDVPLRAGVRAEDLNMAVAARLNDVAVPRAFRGWSFSDGALDLDLRERALRVAGSGRLEAAPIDIVWNEDMTGAKRRRRVEVTGRLDTSARTSLGLPSRPWVDGPIDTRVQLDDVAGDGTVDIEVNLADASVDLPVLAVAKAPGPPARAKARIVLVGGRATRVDPFSFTTGDASLDARATLGPDGRSLLTVDADATMAARDPGRPTVGVRATVREENHIVITSSDAGAVFRTLGAGMNAYGGRLRFEGTLDVAAPETSIEGRLEVRDFTIRNAPALARIATLASLSGIAGALDRDGVRFDSLDAGIGQRSGTLSITDGVLRGRALDLLAAGTIDRAARSAALHGTLVPSFYGLNTLPARVPVIGGVVGGKGREGIQAIDFTIKGPLDAPEVSVSPSSLAPGAFRDLVRKLGGAGR